MQERYLLALGNREPIVTLLIHLHNYSASKFPGQHTISVRDYLQQEMWEGHTDTFSHQSETARYYHEHSPHRRALCLSAFEACRYDAVLVSIERTDDELLLVLRVLALCRVPLLLFIADDTREDELRTLCERAGIHSSALKIVRGDPKEESIGRLLYQNLEALFQDRTPNSNHFLLPIEDTFQTKSGLVVTGRVARGIVHQGERVEIVGERPTREAIVTSIEVGFGPPKSIASRGCNIGLLLSELQPGDVSRGEVVAAPNTMQRSDTFEAAIYLQEDPTKINLIIVVGTWAGELRVISGQLEEGQLAFVTLQTSERLALDATEFFYLIHKSPINQNRDIGRGLVTKIVAPHT